MFEAVDGDAVQAPAPVVSLNLAPDGFAAEEATYQPAFGLPASVDLDLIGDGGRPAIEIKRGGALQQPTAIGRPQRCGIKAGNVEPYPCRELAQPRASVTG